MIHALEDSCVETVDQALKRLIRSYSIEVVARDPKGIATASAALRPGTEVFVPSLPKDTVDNLVVACVAQRRAGMIPVPHITARTISSRAVLARTLQRLAVEAQVDQALVIGGDVDKAVGEFDAALQLIETGLFEANGIKRIALAVHPEGHPRVPDAVLWPALLAKLTAAAEHGLDTYLVSQFAFDAGPYIATAKRLRASGISQPLRVGVAGPAKRSTLIKYGLMCGIGNSLRALRERHNFAKSMAGGETPAGLLRELAVAQAANPWLDIDGVHFFTFGSVEGSVRLVQSLCSPTSMSS